MSSTQSAPSHLNTHLILRFQHPKDADEIEPQERWGHVQSLPPIIEHGGTRHAEHARGPLHNTLRACFEITIRDESLPGELESIEWGGQLLTVMGAPDCLRQRGYLLIRAAAMRNNRERRFS
jgi:hypothetical protein